jgi:hypothetical protein
MMITALISSLDDSKPGPSTSSTLPSTSVNANLRMLNEICSPELVAEILRDQASEYDCNKCKNKVKI